ncbi:Fungal zn(2)-cys(6) binuclear cluster domain containing protein [Ceratobasidium theobromae]|uniref:Fungal zn(2)-cys(6) binuclear cluster domain containing protein n=1 Tax=Ceratobasidium theobromae TaxID=1582974 RepID=A0A5N5QGL4_9AGAM|nr:Fungal zn(2)-cys(6) binuclear cluster domain containing protein [Ceratobasidium theobromae]
MYIGARILRALIDDTNWETYIDWINDFHKDLVNIPVDPLTSIEELATRLDALHTTALFTFILLKSSAGYSFYRQCMPAFLQLAFKFPELWTKDSAISILHALRARRFEITQFVFVDTITALIFGIAPLLHYDTSFHDVNQPRDRSSELLERIYSCPPTILFLLAKINSSRTLGPNGQADSNRLAHLEIEEHLQKWQPTTEKDEDSSNGVVRLAVLECWRQAVLIYMYMGMCGADSVDPRVQTAVRQMAQLASTVCSGSQFEGHLLIPCMIAGVVARKEKHRAIFYTKIQASASLKPTPPLLKLVRAADFICVLNHLWHGTASEGRAITWEDYINSRFAALPLDI